MDDEAMNAIVARVTAAMLRAQAMRGEEYPPPAQGQPERQQQFPQPPRIPPPQQQQPIFVMPPVQTYQSEDEVITHIAQACMGTSTELVGPAIRHLLVFGSSSIVAYQSLQRSATEAANDLAFHNPTLLAAIKNGTPPPQTQDPVLHESLTTTVSSYVIRLSRPILFGAVQSYRQHKGNQKVCSPEDLDRALLGLRQTGLLPRKRQREENSGGSTAPRQPLPVDHTPARRPGANG